jgi:hypothetical protein
LSDAAITTYRPGSSDSRRVNSSSNSAAVTSMATRPPWRMASRALTARFMITCSIWCRSALHGAVGSGQVEDRLDILAEQALQHRSEPFDDFAEAEDLALGDLPTAEGQQLARKPRGAVGGRADLTGLGA